MKKYKLSYLVFFALLASIVASPVSAQAASSAEFNPGRIIDDSIFFNSSGMDANTIQAFLNSKVPICDSNHASSNPQNQPPFTCLKSYRQDIPAKAAEAGLCGAINAGNKSSAQIIFDVSQSCGVSPKVLLVLLEKEQSLVTDDWPWTIQYRSATGYGCPDTAPCDADYYGFFNQVYNAARQFKRYALNESSFRYRAYRDNYIQYNPQASCGGSNIVIQNQATAGLYNYTPYQPNDATKVATPGTTVACGAYGNINFWRLFNNWFGPTTGEGFALMTSANDNGDTRQWVVYKGIKRHVLNAEILRAWRLDQIPLIQTTGLYLGAIVTAPQPLDRLMRPTGTPDVYFVDNGMSYRISSPEYFNAWGLNPAATVDVSEDLARLPANQGDITFSIKTSSDPRVFLMDGGILRHFQNNESVEAFEGSGTSLTIISQDYFSRIPLGAPISSPRVNDSAGNGYIVSNRTRLSLSALTTNLFPWVSTEVSAATLQRMGKGVMYPFIRPENDVRVYLVDGQQKHHIIDPDVLSAWQTNSQPAQVTVVSKAVTNLIPEGSQLSDYYAQNGTDYYLINKTKKRISQQLVTSYTGTRNVYAASATILSTFSNGSDVSNFVKPQGQPQAFLLTKSGVLRHITSTEKYNLWAGAQNVTDLSSANISRYINGGGIGAFVSDGTVNYVMNGGTKAAVTNQIKSNWGLNIPDILNDGTLSNFSTVLPLTNDFQNSGQFFLVSEGISYGTVDSNIANVWTIDKSPVQNLALVGEFLKPQSLTRFVLSKRQDDTRLFVVDKGNLYHLTPEQSLNLNASGPFMYVNPEVITKQPIVLWGGILVKNDSGDYYIIDNGKKRSFANSMIFDHWRRTVPTSSIPTVSDGFTSAMPHKGPIERAIKGSSSSVYSADSVTKSWIRSTQTYNSSFAPYAQVSDSLINVLPSRTDIP